MKINTNYLFGLLFRKLYFPFTLIFTEQTKRFSFPSCNEHCGSLCIAELLSGVTCCIHGLPNLCGGVKQQLGVTSSQQEALALSAPQEQSPQAQCELSLRRLKACFPLSAVDL